MIMKKFTLFFIALQMLVSAFAQENLYVCHKDGTYTEFSISDVEKVRLESDGSPYTPDDGSYVPKPFSVNHVQKVYFSPGNLQYHPVKNEWRFAPSQTGYIGQENSKTSPTYNGWIDLFGFGTGDNPTNTHNWYDTYEDYVEWGDNKIGDYAPNTWRTPTNNEWDYLINGRENAENLIAVAQVDGVNGVILLPDDWKCPSDVNFKVGLNTYDTGYADYQTISDADWEKLEHSGAVFLPAAGYRNGTEVKSVQTIARYWASYWHMTTTAGVLDGTARRVEMGLTAPYIGCSVRLVLSEFVE